MNAEAKKLLDGIKRKSDLALNSIVKSCNTGAFVDDLMQRDGLSKREVDDFFVGLVKICLAKDVVLPRSGYMDLVRFAGRKGLLKKFKGTTGFSIE
jgi:hypothetical protein